jgi:EmrB/QacA subfamily drug resistance transporter
MKPLTSDSVPCGLVTVTVLLGTVTVSLNNTALNPAVPEFMQAFNSSTVVTSWIIIGFMISMGMTMPVTSFLSQKFSKRSVYLFALTLFLISSIAGALSSSLSEVIAVRITQGIAAGLMIPLSLGLIFEVYPKNKRGRVTGIWGAAVMLAPAVGPVVGGLLLEFYDWPALFIMNIPLVILSLISGFYCLPAAKENNKAQMFDWLGFILVTLGVGILMLALSQLANDKAFIHNWNTELILLAFFCLGLFIHVELRQTEPLLSIRIFAIRCYWLSVLLSVVLFISMFQSFVVFPLLMKNVLGYGAIWTGVALLVTALFTSIFANISGKILDSQGPRTMVFIGLLLSAIATIALGFITPNTSLITIFTLMAIRGIGFGFAYITVTTAGLNAIPEPLVTQGSAMNNIARRVSTSAAIIFITFYFDMRTTQLLSVGTTTALSNLTAINEIFIATGVFMLLAVPFALLLPKPRQIQEEMSLAL